MATAGRAECMCVIIMLCHTFALVCVTSVLDYVAPPVLVTCLMGAINPKRKCCCAQSDEEIIGIRVYTVVVH